MGQCASLPEPVQVDQQKSGNKAVEKTVDWDDIEEDEVTNGFMLGEKPLKFQPKQEAHLPLAYQLQADHAGKQEYFSFIRPKDQHVAKKHQVPYYWLDCSEGQTVIPNITFWMTRYKEPFRTKERTIPGPRPLFIDGGAKSGKSHVLNLLLPALLAQDKFFGVGQKRQATSCKLKLSGHKEGNYSHILQAFLTQLLEWSGNKVSKNPGRGAEELEQEILKWFGNMPRTTCFCIDEVHHLLCVEPVDSKRATAFLEQLILQSPKKCLFALTSSCMDAFTQQLAKFSQGVHGLNIHNRTITLPSDAPQHLTTMSWSLLTNSLPLPDALRPACLDKLPAQQCLIARAFMKDGKRLGKNPDEEDCAKFVEQAQSSWKDQAAEAKERMAQLTKAPVKDDLPGGVKVEFTEDDNKEPDWVTTDLLSAMTRSPVWGR